MIIQSEARKRKTNIIYNAMYIGNLERWYYLQGSLGDSENSLTDLGVEKTWGGESGTNGERGMETHTPPYVKQPASGVCCVTQGAQTGALGHPRGWGGRRREVQRERTHVCRWLVHVDAAETNTVCKAITLPLNVNFKKIRNEVILELDVFED